MHASLKRCTPRESDKFNENALRPYAGLSFAMISRGSVSRFEHGQDVALQVNGLVPEQLYCSKWMTQEGSPVFNTADAPDGSKALHDEPPEQVGCCSRVVASRWSRLLRDTRTAARAFHLRLCRLRSAGEAWLPGSTAPAGSRVRVRTRSSRSRPYRKPSTGRPRSSPRRWSFGSTPRCRAEIRPVSSLPVGPTPSSGDALPPFAFHEGYARPPGDDRVWVPPATRSPCRPVTFLRPRSPNRSVASCRPEASPATASLSNGEQDQRRRRHEPVTCSRA